MTDYPHVPAAFINAIAEEGTKADAVKWLQKTWNELCAVRAHVQINEEPAFPQIVAVGPAGDVYYPSPAGMTLRDYFASQTLGGFLAYTQFGEQIHKDPAHTARVAYALADAMLAERSKP